MPRRCAGPAWSRSLQREQHVMLTGPTTLLATLTSLQMGFRTLALEKRTSEVWEMLGAVKTEFGKFGDVLAKTKKKLDEASNDDRPRRGAHAGDGARAAQRRGVQRRSRAGAAARRPVRRRRAAGHG